MPRVTLKGLGPPFPKQREIIDYLMQPTGLTKRVNLMCGLGFSKTTLGIIVAIKVLCLPGDQTILFLEPDKQRAERIFLKLWQKIVPKELYTLNKGEKSITWINGNILYYDWRNISGNQSDVADKFRGIELTAVIDDEAAIKFNRKQYQATFDRLRASSKVRFYLTVSTPQVGAYTQFIAEPGQKLFRGYSWDNPYVMVANPNYIEDMRAMKSPAEFRREVLGEPVALEDRIWPDAVLDEYWPNGNLSGYEYDPTKPYILSVDIGVQSAWLLTQNFPVYGDDGWPSGLSVDVAVAQVTPNHSDTQKTCIKINEFYGEPSKINIGHDANTRGVNINTSAVQTIYRSVGWQRCAIAPVVGIYKDKDIQKTALERAILRADGHRQLCVSDNIRIIGEDNHRGIKEVLEQDIWPDVSRPGELMPKDKREHGGSALEDMRDAMLHWAINTYPVTQHLATGLGHAA